MKAKIYIKYKDGILDPQGATVGEALKSMGYKSVDEVSVGKFIELNFTDIYKIADVEKITDEACKKLLANPNTESYTFEIVES
mgnify:CR=1 FL=1